MSSPFGVGIWRKRATLFFFSPSTSPKSVGIVEVHFNPPIHKSTKDDDAPFKDRIQTGLPHPLSFRCKQKEDLPKCDLSLN
jgi:hypothetical protein